MKHPTEQLMARALVQMVKRQIKRLMKRSARGLMTHRKEWVQPLIRPVSHAQEWAGWRDEVRVELLDEGSAGGIGEQAVNGFADLGGRA